MIWALEENFHDKEPVSAGHCNRHHACIKPISHMLNNKIIILSGEN